MCHESMSRSSRSATEILEDVHKEFASYVITVDGEPVATVRPNEPSDDDPSPEEIEAWLRKLDEVATEIAKVWPEGLSAADAIAEQRRQL